MVDRVLAMHARRLQCVGIQLIAFDDAVAVVLPETEGKRGASERGDHASAVKVAVSNERADFWMSLGGAGSLFVKPWRFAAPPDIERAANQLLPPVTSGNATEVRPVDWKPSRKGPAFASDRGRLAVPAVDREAC